MYVPQSTGQPSSGLSGYSAPSTVNEQRKIGIAGNSPAIKGSSATSGTTLPDKTIEEKRSNSLLSNKSPLTFPSDLPADYYISFNAFKFSQDRATEVKRQFSFEQSVYLPLPSNISDTFGASYDKENLFFFGNAAKEGMNSMMQEGGTVSIQNALNQNVGNLAGKGATNLINTIKNDPTGAGKNALAGALTYLVAGAGGPLAAAAKSSMQVTTNPFPVMIFQGTGFKPPFSFDWTFYPESLEEAKTVRKIIGYFRREMLPEMMAENKSILKVPAIFEIKMVPDSYMRQFKRCVLTNMSVNYAPNGATFISSEDTKVPAAITMSLTFEEIEVWLADDYYADEYNSFGVKDRNYSPPTSMTGTQGVVANNETRGVAKGTPFG